MTKRLVAKTGTYPKDGVEKGEYARLGVILSNENGEYALLDQSVSLAGVLAKQNALAAKQGKPPRDMVAVSIFTDQQQGQPVSQAGQYQQPAGQQQAPQQGDGFDDWPEEEPPF